MAADVARLRTDALDASIKEVYDEFPFDLLDSTIFSDEYVDKFYTGRRAGDHDRVKAAVGSFRRDLAELKAALDECRKCEDQDQLEIALSRARTAASALTQANYGMDLGSHIRACSDSAASVLKRLAFIDFMNANRNDVQILPTLVDRFENMLKRAQIAKNADDQDLIFVDKELLARVLDGSCGFSTAVSVGAWGADVKFLEEGIDDRNLVGCRELGKGAFNKVTLCTYRLENGETVRRVFKPELPARHGWTEAYAAEKEFGRKGSFQQVAMANVTSRKMAEILGVGNAIVKAHLGVHDGRFGLMMDVADGALGSDLIGWISHPPKNPEKTMVGEKSLKDLWDIFSSEDDGQARIVLGNLRHAMTDLEWVDHITGQTDRHASNYMVSVGEDLSVRVVGIDNDLSMTENVEEQRAYPTAISQESYDKLKELDEALYKADGRPRLNATEILSQKLVEKDWPAHDLSPEQLKAMVTRIHNAFVAADSPDCEKIQDNDSWLDMDELKPKYLDRRERLKDERLDLFSLHGIKAHMFPSEHGPFADLETDVMKENRRRGERLRGILNDQEKVQHMVDSAKEGKGDEAPAVSEAELRAYFDLMAKAPAKAVVSLAEKMDDANSKTIEDAIVQLGRRRKKALIEKLRAFKPSDVPSFENDPFVQRCTPQYFRFDSGSAEVIGLHFAMALAAVKGHKPPLAAQKLALLETGGALELAPFVSELLDEFKKSEGVGGSLIAEALVSELEKEETGDDLDEAEVGRLRRLVANKLRVKPEEVLKPEEVKGMTEEQLDQFKTACAITPSGEDYYAQVKANYEWLNG
ncbi:MAG: hypothetical protein MJ249_14840, partial [Kiritimatiellae bacterium]|nr:hypothetical protein [Kiritimatiellia bacterium]